MENNAFMELSRCLEKEEIKSVNQEDKRLEVFLHGQPVLFVSPASDVFLLPAGSKNEKASELYHQVAVVADKVYGYVEAVQNAPLLHASGLHEQFNLLADFGGAVLAGQERENGQGYQFVTWIWDYDRTGKGRIRLHGTGSAPGGRTIRNGSPWTQLPTGWRPPAFWPPENRSG